MKRQNPHKLFALLTGILLVCALCFSAAAESAGNDFVIDGTTLVRYTGSGGEVTVPEGIEELAEGAFERSAVTKVNLPETLKEIRSYCFLECKELTEITLPASLTELEYCYDEKYNGGKCGQAQVFGRNPKLRAINVAEGNPKYQSIDGVLFTADGKTLLYFPGGKNQNEGYVIPEGTEKIDSSAFCGASITSVSLPSTLSEQVWNNTFSSIPTLKEFSVAPASQYYSAEDGVLYYNHETLLSYPCAKEAEHLGPENFPQGLKYIYAWAFQGVENLKSVELPEGVRSIGQLCFTFSESLESVTVPASVESIESYAFADCAALKEVVLLNPEVAIALDEEMIDTDYSCNVLEYSPDAVLRGYAGSTAEVYAEKLDLPFESIPKE